MTACKQEDRLGCENLYKALADPHWTEADRLDGDVYACLRQSVADACLDGVNILSHRPRAETGDLLSALYTQLCRTSNALGCRELATAAREGLGDATEDDTLAALALARACRLGDEPSCKGALKPDVGPRARFDHVGQPRPYAYDPLAAIEALEVALAPCAALPGADDRTMRGTFTIHADGRADFVGTAPEDAIGRCIDERLQRALPAAARPAAADRETVELDAIVRFEVAE